MSRHGWIKRRKKGQKFLEWTKKNNNNALKEIVSLSNIELLKERKLLIWTMTSQWNAPKLHLTTIIELGSNDFRNQRTQVSKNSYFTKNQTKIPVGDIFWFSVYPTIQVES